MYNLKEIHGYDSVTTFYTQRDPPILVLEGDRPSKAHVKIILTMKATTMFMHA